MSPASNVLRDLLLEIRSAYGRGENISKLVRKRISEAESGSSVVRELSILLAYDLQAGTYVQRAREKPELWTQWWEQIAGELKPYLVKNGTILEIGVGEATTLAGVLLRLGSQISLAAGCDLSWSRTKVGQEFLQESGVHAELFVADIAHLPLAAESVDVVYSSHSLESNRGMEEMLISECLRVARKYVVLFEPIFELADRSSQERMETLGYVRDLRGAAIAAGGKVIDYRLLDYSPNQSNPSGVIVIEKPSVAPAKPNRDHGGALMQWACPSTSETMEDAGDFFWTNSVGLAYPKLQGIPLLKSSHAIVASNASG